ncbi:MULTISPECIES: hypothetical protein [Nostoc]|uniref:Uncharacterized protein n=2 Tax=Nostoc TaxID=1177 RepID=A0ABR8I495_9NOSO|nr:MULTISPECIES: hypothetical protein [Nostoc]MBD2560081.1 hypothetical protein [Nostoc linckia FACHB-391]MBD2645741.1 hypothetical protein [Nostoc foliaceum FACHB-393]
MKDELKKKVQAWLEEQGYPLEMKVAKAFAESDFEVRQSSFYIDPESNEVREIDIVVCNSTYVIDVFDVYFVIECKSVSRPWVLFTSENTFANYNKYFAYCLYSEVGKKLFINKTLEILARGDVLTWFNKKGRNGYSMTEAFTSSIDNTYKAAMSALKAAVALKILADENKRLTFIFPVIVVDGSLFESYLDVDGKLVVDAIKKGFLHFPRQTKEVTGTTIYVVTLDYVPEFIVEAKRITTELKELLTDVTWNNYSSYE